MGAEERPGGVAKGEFPGQSENVFQLPKSSAFMAGEAVAVTRMDHMSSARKEQGHQPECLGRPLTEAKWPLAANTTTPQSLPWERG